MAYQKYITEAFVCGTRASNTSDNTFLLFTRDAGMLYARARSVREEKSKQRYALQDFSHIRVTLVRGKGGWRITGVESISNFYSNTKTRDGRAFLRNIVLLLRRLLQGETVHEDIFDDVIAFSSHSCIAPSEKLENVLSLRILHTLGYVAPLEAYKELLDSKRPYKTIDTLSPETEKICEETIEYALTQSQL